MVSKMLMGSQLSQESGLPSDFSFPYLYVVWFSRSLPGCGQGGKMSKEVSVIAREKVKQNQKRKKEGEKGRAMILNRRVACPFLCFTKITL